MQGGDTALIIAAKYGHFFIIRELLSSGANADLTDKVGAGVAYGHESVMIMLLHVHACIYSYCRQCGVSHPIYQSLFFRACTI